MNIYDTLLLVLPWAVVLYIMHKDITSKDVDLFEDVSKK